MKTSKIARTIVLAPRALLAVLVSVSAACNVSGFTDENVAEGQRCNPFASHNECASGLECTTASGPNGQPFAGQSAGPLIPYCPENYCCAVDSNGNIASTDPNCQPGCNGGAAAICTATSDPGACALASGSSLAEAYAADDAGAD